MRTIIHSLLRLGSSVENTNENRFYISTNFVLLSAAFVAFLRIFTVYLHGEVFYALISFVSSLLFVLLYFLNVKGYRDFAKYSFLFIGNLATGYKELNSGGDAEQLYIILLSFSVIFLLFDIRDRLKFGIALVFPTLNIFINLFMPLAYPELTQNIIVQLHGHSNFSDEIIHKNKVVGVFSNLVLSTFFVWYFVKKNNDKEEELTANNALLSNINNDLAIQKEIIQHKNEEIYASIRYAQRIQNAILPWEESMNAAFQNYFIIYKPKDIVSGDFYWLHKKDDIAYFAICDCTGHGISGSMLSMIGSTILEEAVSTKNIYNADEILNYFDYKLTIALNQQIVSNKNRDSIEVGIVKISSEQIEFSGARNHLYFIKNGTLEIIKGDRSSIGGDKNPNEKYTNHKIPNDPNTMIYLTTDGFIDQVGENGKKYGSSKFKEIITKIHNLDLNKQKLFLENELHSHKGNENQRDDITVVGIKTNI